jgi:hypothetical protein
MKDKKVKVTYYIDLFNSKRDYNDNLVIFLSNLVGEEQK